MRRRLSAVIGADRWSYRIEPTIQWLKATLILHLPDGREVVREAVTSYRQTDKDEPTKFKVADSDAFRRVCKTLDIGTQFYSTPPPERLAYQDDQPLQARTSAAPPREATGDAETNSVPQFRDARAFYGWLREHNYLPYAATYGHAHSLPLRILSWSPEQIEAATREILGRTTNHTS
jgi:hypothetical protein